ncbi:MAG: ribonuclease H-like YkuK family protein, partial [Bacillota bacterium]|nr:ribonuclease H-like YkuK family protein [Bacillota bacterium]
MSFDEVFKRIIKFMKLNPGGNFRLMVGTDSQVHETKTIFITGIVIQNHGKGVWACIREVI